MLKLEGVIYTILSIIFREYSQRNFFVTEITFGGVGVYTQILCDPNPQVIKNGLKFGK